MVAWIPYKLGKPFRGLSHGLPRNRIMRRIPSRTGFPPSLSQTDQLPDFAFRMEGLGYFVRMLPSRIAPPGELKAQETHSAA